MGKVASRCKHGLIEEYCGLCHPELHEQPEELPRKRRRRRPNKPKFLTETQPEPTVLIPNGFYDGKHWIGGYALQTDGGKEMPFDDAIKNRFLCHPQRQKITPHISAEFREDVRQSFIKAFLDSPVPPVMETLGDSPTPVLDTFLWAMREITDALSDPPTLTNEFESPVDAPLSNIQGTAYGIEVIVNPTDFEIKEIPIRLFHRFLTPDVTNGKRHPLWDLCYRAYSGDSTAIVKLVDKYHMWAKTMKPAEYDDHTDRFGRVFTEPEYKQGLLYEALHRQRKQDPLPLWIMQVPQDRSPLRYLRRVIHYTRFAFEHVFRGNPKESDLKLLTSFDAPAKGEVEQVDGYSKALAANEMERVTMLGETCPDLHESNTEELAMLKMEADSLIVRVRSMRISRELQDVLLTIATEHGKTTFNEAATLVLGRQGADRIRQEWYRKGKRFLADYLDFVGNRKK